MDNNLNMKKALITGITGQDGSYLAKFLLDKGYEVHGVKRRSSITSTPRINHLYQEDGSPNQKFFLHYGDMTDSTNLIRLISEIKPDEIYNLAAMSHVKVSFDVPEYVADTDGIGTLRLLEAIRILRLENKTKIYQASTSELFGKAQEIPQKETTPFYPRSPYGVAKMYAYWITVNYREAYNLFACNGILFNHESPIRGETFVTRKITMAVSKIALKQKELLTIGNLNSKRDWGHAKDYVEMMWLILQSEYPEDWVISTGKTTSIRKFIELAFGVIGVEIGWKGEGINEIGFVSRVNSKYPHLTKNKTVVKVDPKYFRPTEVDLLVGDSTKAKEKLGWEPKISLEEMVKEMMISDLKLNGYEE